ncbi:hypothetical protein AVEN_199875-1, partial [Araneus ventricosus]
FASHILPQPSLQLLLVLGGPLHGVLDLLQAALDDEVAGRGALLHQPDELEGKEDLCEDTKQLNTEQIFWERKVASVK